MVMFVIANVGLNGSSVFYNSLLPHMGTDDEMDAISNKAFAYGYFGGGILLLIHLVMTIVLVDSEGEMYSWVIPSIMASSGLWWYGFALLTFKWVPEPPIENEMDALSIFEGPIIEIHITNIHAREEFRHKSFISNIAYGIIAGFGFKSYELAIDAIADKFSK